MEEVKAYKSKNGHIYESLEKCKDADILYEMSKLSFKENDTINNSEIEFQFQNSCIYIHAHQYNGPRREVSHVSILLKPSVVEKLINNYEQSLRIR